jgi:hypothetical protein
MTVQNGSRFGELFEKLTEMLNTGKGDYIAAQVGFLLDGLHTQLVIQDFLGDLPLQAQRGDLAEWLMDLAERLNFRSEGLASYLLGHGELKDAGV